MKGLPTNVNINKNSVNFDKHNLKPLYSIKVYLQISICLPSLWSIKFDVLSFSSFKPDNHAFGQFCGFDSGLGHI